MGWGLGKVTDGFVPSPSLDADGDLPGFKELLSTQSFVERLEAARIRRAKVLAEQAQDADDQSVFLKTTRPWEHAKPPTPVRKAHRPTARKIGQTESRPAAKPYLLLSPNAGVTPKNALVPVTATPITVASQGSKPTAARVAGGFGLGVLLGAGALIYSLSSNGPGVAPAESTVALSASTQSAPAEVVPLAPTQEPNPSFVLAAATSLPVRPTYEDDIHLAPASVASPSSGGLASTAFPGQIHNVSAVTPALPEMPPSQTVPSVGSIDQSLAGNGSGIQVDRAGPLPGAITKVTLLSAPAVLPDGTGRNDRLLAGPGLPSLPPTVGWAQPAVSAPVVYSFATAANLTVETYPMMMAGRSVPPLLASFDADTALSGAALAPPPPYVAGDEAAQPGNSLIDFAAYNVFLNAPESMAGVEVSKLAETLTDTGFAVSEPILFSFKVSKNHVRYYHPSDAEAAQILADEIGGPARDFTNFRPSPPTGKIEIWLAGSGSQKAKSTARTKKRTAQQPQSDAAKLRALRDRLILQLRTGQHL